jgi:hypothetical protein
LYRKLWNWILLMPRHYPKCCNPNQLQKALYHSYYHLYFYLALHHNKFIWI